MKLSKLETIVILFLVVILIVSIVLAPKGSYITNETSNPAVSEPMETNPPTEEVTLPKTENEVEQPAEETAHLEYVALDHIIIHIMQAMHRVAWFYSNPATRKRWIHVIHYARKIIEKVILIKDFVLTLLEQRLGLFIRILCQEPVDNLDSAIEIIDIYRAV
jgi:hypothetical protein